MRRTLSVLLLLACPLPAVAAELSGVTMPDRVSIEDQELILNGMGLRKKSIIKVYVAGLYLPQKMIDASTVLAADTPRHLVMDFKFGVSKEKMCAAWQEGLEANSPGAGSELEQKFSTLCEYMADMGKGETMAFTYLPETGTSVSVDGEEQGVITGKAFADALFACWIGPHPPGAAFKTGLLGG